MTLLYAVRGRLGFLDEAEIAEPGSPTPEADPGVNQFSNSKWLGDGNNVTGWSLSGDGTLTMVAGDNGDRYARFQATTNAQLQLTQDRTLEAGVTATLSFKCFAALGIAGGSRVMVQAVPFSSAGNVAGRPLVTEMVVGERFGWTITPSETRSFALRFGPGADGDTSVDVTIGEPMLDISDKLREYDATDPPAAPPTEPVEGDAPTNGWQLYSTSQIGWLPAGVNAGDFSQSRWPSSAPNNRIGAESPAAAMGEAVYRMLVNNEPCYLLQRLTSDQMILPQNNSVWSVDSWGCGGVHLEWYQWYSGDFWTGNGKRFGLRSQFGAAGSRVPANASNYDFGNTVINGEGGFGNDGGWSTRYFPRRVSLSNLAGLYHRPALYTYCQNRGNDFNAPGGNGSRLFGATFNGATITHSQQINRAVRMNLTWIANSNGQKNGRLILWKDGQISLNQGGIMWQNTMTSYPPYMLWWDWMFGGTETNSNLIPFGNRANPPATAKTEYYNRFRAIITTRANALANPWPFA